MSSSLNTLIDIFSSTIHKLIGEYHNLMFTNIAHEKKRHKQSTRDQTHNQDVKSYGPRPYLVRQSYFRLISIITDV